MNKKWIACICAGILVLGLAGRIWYVNQNARLPEINRVPQGESAVWSGLKFQITHAELWDYEEFYKAYDAESHMFEGELSSEWDAKVIVLEFRIDRIEEEADTLNIVNPIVYVHTRNDTDTFLTAAINPNLQEGTFRSGETIRIPYTIFEFNIGRQNWKKVENMTMQYTVRLGNYPVRNEMLVTDIEKM